MICNYLPEKKHIENINRNGFFVFIYPLAEESSSLERRGGEWLLWGLFTRNPFDTSDDIVVTQLDVPHTKNFLETSRAGWTLNQCLLSCFVRLPPSVDIFLNFWYFSRFILKTTTNLNGHKNNKETRDSAGWILKRSRKKQLENLSRENWFLLFFFVFFSFDCLWIEFEEKRRSEKNEKEIHCWCPKHQRNKIEHGGKKSVRVGWRTFVSL